MSWIAQAKKLDGNLIIRYRNEESYQEVLASDVDTIQAIYLAFQFISDVVIRIENQDVIIFIDVIY